MKSLILITLSMVLICQAHSDNYNWDIIDRQGNVVHKVYNARSVSPFSEGILVIKYKDRIVFLNEDFEETFSSSSFSSAPFEEMQNNRLGFYDRDSGKLGYLNRDGKVVIKPQQYDYIGTFVHGYALVGFGDTSEPPPHHFEYRIIDLFGNYASPIIFDRVELSRYDPGKGIGSKPNENITFFIKLNQSQWKIAENKGDFKEIVSKGFGERLVARTEDGFGVITWEGEILLKPAYKAIWSVSKWGALVTIRRNHIVVNYEGNEILADKDVRRVWSDYAVFIGLNDKQGVYDLSQEKDIVPPMYDSIVLSSGNEFQVSLDGKKGYVNSEGEVLGEIKYDLTLYFSDGLGVAGIIIED